jgi:hypothetical protein
VAGYLRRTYCEAEPGLACGVAAADVGAGEVRDGGGGSGWALEAPSLGDSPWHWLVLLCVCSLGVLPLRRSAAAVWMRASVARVKSSMRTEASICGSGGYRTMRDEAHDSDESEGLQ